MIFQKFLSKFANKETIKAHDTNNDSYDNNNENTTTDAKISTRI